MKTTMKQFRLLPTLQLLEMRRGWVISLIFSTLVPLIVAFGLNLRFSWWLLAVVPLSICAMTGLGALIGTYLAPHPVPIVASGSLFILLFVSPVLIPLSSLPAVIRWFGYALPPSYAAVVGARALLGCLLAAGLPSDSFQPALTISALRSQSWRASSTS